MAMVRCFPFLILIGAVGCQLADNRLNGQVRNGSTSDPGPTDPPPPLPPVSNPLAFTGASDPTTAPSSRVVSEVDGSWMLAGTCDATLGDVTLSGMHIRPASTHPCKNDGTFEIEIGYDNGDPAPYFYDPPHFDVGSKFIKVSQGSSTFETTIYKIDSSHPPTFISTVTELQAMVSGDDTVFYILTDDVDVALATGNRTNNWTPVGNSTVATFSGRFDGGGHSIRNVYVNSSATEAGFFGQTFWKSRVGNVSFVNAVVDAPTSTYVGTVAGDADGSYFNVHAENSLVVGGNNVGGLFGWIEGYYATDVYMSGVVRASGAAGGIAAFVQLSLSQCSVHADIIGTMAGGLGGQMAGGSSAENCMVTGSVKGTDFVGGIVGANQGPLSQVFAMATVQGTSNTGRIVGANSAVVTNAFAASDLACSGCTFNIGTVLPTSSLLSEVSYTGFDFVNETSNGTDDIWMMPTAGGPPIFSWQDHPPRSEYCWNLARFTNTGFANSGEPGVDGGTISDTSTGYSICTAQQFNRIGATPADWDKYFRLEDHINLGLYTGTQYNVIGTSGSPFTGGLLGKDYSISHLTYTSSINYVGLFGKIETVLFPAHVWKLDLINVNIAGNSYVGALAGQSETATFHRVSATGKVTGAGGTQHYIGGLIGEQVAGQISYSWADVDITSSVGQYHGGFVGGGFVQINECYAKGDVTSGGSRTGGLVGYVTNGTMARSFSAGDVTGNDASNRVGRFYGFDTGSGDFFDAYYDNQSGCGNLGGSCDPQTDATGIDTSGANADYFFLKTNSPLSQWDFDDVWIEVPNSYPTLRRSPGQ